MNRLCLHTIITLHHCPSVRYSSSPCGVVGQRISHQYPARSTAFQPFGRHSGVLSRHPLPPTHHFPPSLPYPGLQTCHQQTRVPCQPRPWILWGSASSRLATLSIICMEPVRAAHLASFVSAQSPGVFSGVASPHRTRQVSREVLQRPSKARSHTALLTCAQSPSASCTEAFSARAGRNHGNLTVT
jgi:hypothetical protein